MNFSCYFRDRIAEKVNQRSEVISQRLDKMVNECNLDQSQQQADVRYVLEESSQMSTSDTAKKMHAFFTDKYPLKMWAAIVYDADDVHKYNFARFQSHAGGKNAIVVARSRGSKPLFTQSKDLDTFTSSDLNMVAIFIPAQRIFRELEQILPSNIDFGVMRVRNALGLEHDKDMTVIMKQRGIMAVFVVPYSKES